MSVEKAGRKGQEKASTYALVMVTVCVVINIGCGYLAGRFSLPFWLDTIGTMAAAIAFGPCDIHSGGTAAFAGSYAFYQKSGDEKSKEQQEAEQLRMRQERLWKIR
jgi:hypothetical protein